MSTPANILDLPAISGCYLFPQARYVSDPFTVPVEGAELACHRTVTDADQLTLVHFHGNGETVADYIPWMSEALTELGLNSLFVEYRAYGASTGKAQLSAMLGDGEAVLAAAGLAPERVIAFGRSIGSLYAIELVHRLPTIAGLVIESGIAAPSERFLARANLSGTGLTAAAVEAAARETFDHQKKLSGYTNPLLILHTENDGLIDMSHAERNYRWCGSAQKQLLRFPLGNHNSILGMNRREYFQALKEFVMTVGQEGASQ